MSIELRYYQADAIAACYNYMRANPGKNPCIEIPTAGGKTPVIAQMCRDITRKWNGRVIVLAHVKELLQQAEEKILRMDKNLRVGVYSAGLNRRETNRDIIIAGIQSVFRKPDIFGKINVVIIDEAHLIPPDGDGMYRTFLAGLKETNLRLRVVGLTATPFRMKSGPIVGDDQILDEICYRIGVKKLINDGYICQMRSKGAKAGVSMENVHVRGGDFVAKEMEQRFLEAGHTETALADILQKTKDRKKVLIFSSGVNHAEKIAAWLREHQEEKTEIVTGKTPADKREQILEDFKNGATKYLVNVNVLTTGFDAPNIDAVVLLRATMSPGLYYQMVGRGFRIHPDKKDCVVLDYGENIARHGPVDTLSDQVRKRGTGGKQRPVTKRCPRCEEVVLGGVRVCPACGYTFPKPVPDPKWSSLRGEATNRGVVSGQVSFEWVDVKDVTYYIHEKRKPAPGKPPLTLKVEYSGGIFGIDKYAEWICFDHSGFVRRKAEKWWRERSAAPIPRGVEEAFEMLPEANLLEPSRIKIKHVAGNKYPEIVEYDFTEPPEEEIDMVDDDTLEEYFLQQGTF